MNETQISEQDKIAISTEYRRQWRSPKSLRLARVAFKHGLDEAELAEMLEEWRVSE